MPHWVIENILFVFKLLFWQMMMVAALFEDDAGTHCRTSNKNAEIPTSACAQGAGYTHAVCSKTGMRYTWALTGR